MESVNRVNNVTYTKINDSIVKECVSFVCKLILFQARKCVLENDISISSCLSYMLPFCYYMFPHP